MKYCRYCGNEIAEEAVVCVRCGRLVNEQPLPSQKSQTNILCILGFALSFFTAVVGLVLSIIGYNQVKNSGESTNKTLAKAGIIISSISMGLAFLAVFIWIYIFVIVGIVLI